MAQRIDNRDDLGQTKIANAYLPIGTILLLADASVVACDPAVEQLLGYTAFQLVGTTWFDPIWQTIRRDGTQFEPEDLPAIASLRTGEPGRNVEMGFYKPSGELVWLQVDTTPLFQPQTPNPYGVVVTMCQYLRFNSDEFLCEFGRDISDPKQVEPSVTSIAFERDRSIHALHESEQKYRTLFDSIDESFCICEMLFDENGKPTDYRFLEVNSRFKMMTGLEQATGKTARELVPNLEAFWFETYGRVVQTGEPVRFENQSLVMNRWFDVYAFPFGEPHSNLFAVLFTNISARKQAEAQLHSVAQADAFRVKLADALRAPTDADEIQATAARVLGESLKASRVIYIEVVSGGKQVIVHQNYTNGVAELNGLYSLEDYGRNLINDHAAGKNAIVPDVQNHPKYEDSAKERFRAIDIAAHIDVPLIKNNQFVALLAVHQSTPRQWTEDEVKLVEETAERTWAAVERARAETALRESEARLQQAIAIETVGAIFFNTDGQITEANDAFLRMSGYSREDIEQGLVRWDAMTPPEWMPQSLKAIEELETIGRTTPYEKEYICKDGSRWWALFAARRLNETESVKFIIDISDRKQAEAEREQLLQREQDLRQQAETAEAKLQEIVASIREDFVLFDRNWQIIYLNPQAAETMRMSRDEILGSSMWNLFPDLVGTEFYERLHQVMRHRILTQFEYYYSTWDCWFENRVYPTPDGIVNLCINISDRKRIEEELRQKNAILDAINESAPTPIFVKDRQGRIIYANPATLEVLGRSAAEVIGYRDCDLYPNPEDAAEVMENDRRIMESGEIEVVEESPDGIRTFLAMKSPYRNQAGEVIGLIGISNDISDRVQLERDRERILQQEQAAREAAEQANRIKDEFLAVLSHELRSPLNPILGWTKLLQSGKLDAAKTAQALATIERNAKLQTELISDLLDVSRILRGKLNLNIYPVNLVTLIEAAIETVSLAAEAKAIDIQIQLDAEVGQVSGDASRLQQVVWNLVSNAVKFTPQGGRVTVKLERLQISDQNKSSNLQSEISNLKSQTFYAQITVTDTGKGINPEFLPHVFDYFRQEDAAITRKFGGLGLGLAIVRHLVELHGGTVEANSPGEGQGATFTVRLPLSAGRKGENLEPQKSLVATVENPLTGIRVLVVDDEPDMRDIIGFSLQQAGAEVIVATGAVQALKELVNFQPNILLSDIGMPDMDGYMLLRQIRKLPAQHSREVKAIALTAYAAEFDQKQALEAGFQKHLAKPIEPDILVREVLNLLSN